MPGISQLSTCTRLSFFSALTFQFHSPSWYFSVWFSARLSRGSPKATTPDICESNPPNDPRFHRRFVGACLKNVFVDNWLCLRTKVDTETACSAPSPYIQRTCLASTDPLYENQSFTDLLGIQTASQEFSHHTTLRIQPCRPNGIRGALPEQQRPSQMRYRLKQEHKCLKEEPHQGLTHLVHFPAVPHWRLSARCKRHPTAINPPMCSHQIRRL